MVDSTPSSKPSALLSHYADQTSPNPRSLTNRLGDEDVPPGPTSLLALLLAGVGKGALRGITAFPKPVRL